MKLKLYLPSFAKKKANSKHIKDQNVKPEILKKVKENKQEPFVIWV